MPTPEVINGFSIVKETGDSGVKKLYIKALNDAAQRCLEEKLNNIISILQGKETESDGDSVEQSSKNRGPKNVQSGNTRRAL